MLISLLSASDSRFRRLKLACSDHPQGISEPGAIGAVPYATVGTV